MKKNAATTKTRTVRVDEDLWQASKQAAAANGETVTDVVVRALADYTAAHAAATPRLRDLLESIRGDFPNVPDVEILHIIRSGFETFGPAAEDADILAYAAGWLYSDRTRA